MLVAALAATALFFHRALGYGQVFVERDLLRVYYPLRQYWAERVAHGEFPAWYPYDGLGQPFAGMVISSAFHPSNLLFLILPLGAAMSVNVLLCFPLACAGVYCFARRWGLGPASAALGAIVYSFSGYLVCITNNPLYLMAAATFPWALWAMDRWFEAPTMGRLLAAAALLALLLLCGDSQSFVISAGLGVVIAVARHQARRGGRELAAAAALFTLAGVLAMVQVLPALAVAAEGKLAHQTLAAAEAWSTHPLRLFDLALGPLFAGPSGDVIGATISRELLGTAHTTLWVNSLHVGMPALVLGLAALVVHRRRPRAWLVAGSVVGLFLLACGAHTGLYGVLFRLVPPWRMFRYPEKLMPYVVFGLALGAASGLEVAESSERARRRIALALAATALGCGLLAVMEATGGVFSSRVVVPLWQDVSAEALARLASAFTRNCSATAVATGSVAAVMVRVRQSGSRAALVIAVTFLHLLVANEWFYEVAPTHLLTRPGPLVDAIRSAEGPPRLGGYRVNRLDGPYGADYAADPAFIGLGETARYARSVTAALEPVTPALWGIEGANKYLPGTSQRVGALVGDELRYFTRYAPLFGTRYTSVSMQDAAEMADGTRVVARDAALQLLLVEHAAARPRVYLARPRCVRSAEEAYQQLAADEPLPPEEAVVECPFPLPAVPSEVTDIGHVAIVGYAPERVEVEAVATTDALLVLNDAFYGGWRVEVDDRPGTILLANYAVRGVPLARGAHRVVFSYHTPGLGVGATVSMLALLASLVGVFCARRRA